MSIKVNFIICCAIVLLSFVGCGKFHEKFGRDHGRSTQVTFSSATLSAHGLMNDALMIYAVNANNVSRSSAKYFTLADVGGAVWTLPNGTYHFYALGFDTSAMSTMRCAKTESVALIGGQQLVNLALDDDGVCGTPPFSPTGTADTADKPNPIYMGLCNNSGTGDLALTGSSTYCDGSSGRPTGTSGTGYITTFPEYDFLDGSRSLSRILGTGMTSGCISATMTGSAPTIVSSTMPLGQPFVVKLDVWMGSGCIAGQVGRFYFTRGLAGAATNSNQIMFDSSLVSQSPSSQQLNFFTNGSANYFMIQRF